MRTVYSGFLTFASFSDGIAQGNGCFFLGFGFIVGTDILELLEFFQQTLIELYGKDSRNLVSLLVSNKSSGGHSRQIYRLMGIGFTGLRIPDIGIDQVEERFLFVFFQMFQISKALEGLFIEVPVQAFPHQVIQGHVQGISDLFGGIDGGSGFAPFIFTDHDAGYPTLILQIDLAYSFLIPQFGNDFTRIHI
jgi:hypothetical protein